MTRDEHLQLIAIEECGELAHRLSKALRFGMDQVQPNQPLTNRERIIAEYCDLIAAMEMIGITSLDRAMIDAKHRKVERYLAFCLEGAPHP